MTAEQTATFPYEFTSPPVYLADALKTVLPAGYIPSESTLTRWVNVGLLGADGNRVKLRVAKFGRRYVTTVGDVAAFFAASCRSSDAVDVAEGREMFEQHVLTGPNLMYPASDSN